MSMRTGIAEHHTDLLAELVDEDDRRVGAADRGRQLAHRLGHQPGLEADVTIPHFTIDFGLGNQGGD